MLYNPNKSAQIVQTSLAKEAHYPHIAWIPDLKSQHGDHDHPKSSQVINRSLYHWRAILKILAKSTHLLSNGQISDWTVSMVIQIVTKI